MRSAKKLILEQLDRKLAPFNEAAMVQVPEKGWIHTIRTGLNMTLAQLGNRLNISKQGIRKLEENEASNAITLKSLKQVAIAMDVKFIYGFVPNDGTFENLVDKKSRTLAENIVRRTHHNMLLENQETNAAQVEKAITELTQEIKREVRRGIWD